MTRKASFLLALCLLAIVLLAFELTSLDLVIQDAFFSEASGTWIVPKRARIPRIVFYSAPKVLLIAFGIWMLISLVWRKSPGPGAFHLLSARPRRELLYLLLCLALFPALIGFIKKVSGLHCPSELARYGGEHPYRKIFSARPTGPADPGHCFPAGHASGGFALLNLWFVAKSPRSRKRALLLALGFGWSMGLYQMLNGAHFLSHTIVTMLLAWIFTLSLAILFRLPAPSSTQNRATDCAQPQHHF